MTIDELLAALGVDGDDLLAIYDKNAPSGTEPTQKITITNFVSSILTLGKILTQSSIVNNLTNNDPNIEIDLFASAISLPFSYTNFISILVTFSGTTNADGYLVTDIPESVFVLNASASGYAIAPLRFNQLWYFLMLDPTGGDVKPKANQAITISYYYI